MAGILNPKRRFFDTILTQEGKRQVAQGDLRFRYVSFSDGMTFYEKSSEDPKAASDATNRIFLRNHLRHARMASCDDQGRVILSKQLIKYAKIVKDLTIIGVLNKVEIWDKRTLIFSDKKTVVDDDSYEELSKKVTV